MKYTIITIWILTLGISCKNPTKEINEVKFSQELADELKKRAELDQTAAWIPEGKFKEYTQEEWKSYKDSVFTTNKVFLEEILNKYGYPGYDLVGKEGEKNYWVMAQHCDFAPAFQAKVLEKLKQQVENGNADGRNYGLLTDRVNLNTGKKQFFGTQVKYVRETGQAIPKPLKDSLNVNGRRKLVGLEPIEEYLNKMTKSHFEMNKENMLTRGITEPKLHEIKK